MMICHFSIWFLKLIVADVDLNHLTVAATAILLKGGITGEAMEIISFIGNRYYRIVQMTFWIVHFFCGYLTFVVLHFLITCLNSTLKRGSFPYCRSDYRTL